MSHLGHLSLGVAYALMTRYCFFEGESARSERMMRNKENSRNFNDKCCNASTSSETHLG